MTPKQKEKLISLQNDMLNTDDPILEHKIADEIRNYIFKIGIGMGDDDHMCVDSEILSRIEPLLVDVAQILDGWHADGTEWSKWDESVRSRVSNMLSWLVACEAKSFWRDSVKAFADAMEEKLRKNDHKNDGFGDCGWERCTYQYLSTRLVQEIKEMKKAIGLGKPPKDVLDECADVANFCMMIAENYQREQENWRPR